MCSFPAPEIPAIVSEEKIESNTQTVKSEDNGHSARRILKQEEGSFLDNGKLVKTEILQGTNLSRDIADDEDERKLKRQKR